MEYEKCLVELDEILNHLDPNDLEKIPSQIRRNIKEKKSKNYIWKYDENKELKEQNIDRRTISMLSYLNMQYLVSSEQKELLEKMHKFNEMKMEKEKKEKYKVEDLFNKSNKRRYN